MKVSIAIELTVDEAIRLAGLSLVATHEQVVEDYLRSRLELDPKTEVVVTINGFRANLHYLSSPDGRAQS